MLSLNELKELKSGEPVEIESTGLFVSESGFSIEAPIKIEFYSSVGRRGRTIYTADFSFSTKWIDGERSYRPVMLLKKVKETEELLKTSGFKSDYKGGYYIA